ncbi:hypothetical protein R5W23_005130 [Gemmata sp. JC673]|uniref:Alginate export domain-containing protein n=1 Tax=Gemmata algarum TaxID=2975278 RepID=A0ABU5FAT0_9BACT|nr:hypothetical protein [Gemmata algarum]MDY3563518.1 hypothetical protein [Gemmata algarum]
MPRAVWVALTLVTVGTASPAGAQPLGPLEPLPPAESLGSTPVRPAQSVARAAPVLGAPVAVAGRAPQADLTPTGFVDAPVNPQPRRGAAFGAPVAAATFGTPAPEESAAAVPAALVDKALARTAYTAPTADTVNEFLTKRSALKDKDKGKDEKLPAPKRSSWKFGDALEGVFGSRNGGWFRSDHMFDGFISPVSNPFLAEDPRSLTELRPIFIYQKVPTDQRDFRGGHITFFGAQGRVAFTDRWSLVFHKFGGVTVNPDGASRFGDETGFAELWLGPKYTFYRGEENGALAAGGVQFQLPVGSSGAFQNTGSLSLVPYVTYGQNFLRDLRLGSFNSIITSGYSFSTNNERSDYYWLSAHLDFDVMNTHRFYPLAELNWFLTTTRGTSTTIGSEGRDLINFGGQAKHGLLTGALGGRVKLNEHAQFGTAFEIPFAGPKDLFRYRFTIDFILRY